jgi:succinate-acetate transporter protein
MPQRSECGPLRPGFCWTASQIGVLLPQQLTVIFAVLIVYSGPVLFIAGLLLYRRNEAFLGSSFCSFGAFNLTRGILLLCMSFGLSHGVGTEVQGIMMEVFAYIALSLSLGGIRINVVVLLTFSCTFVGFLLSGPPFIADMVGHPGWKQLGQVGGGFPARGLPFWLLWRERAAGEHCVSARASADRRPSLISDICQSGAMS